MEVKRQFSADRKTRNLLKGNHYSGAGEESSIYTESIGSELGGETERIRLEKVGEVERYGSLMQLIYDNEDEGKQRKEGTTTRDLVKNMVKRVVAKGVQNESKKENAEMDIKENDSDKGKVSKKAHSTMTMTKSVDRSLYGPSSIASAKNFLTANKGKNSLNTIKPVSKGEKQGGHKDSFSLVNDLE